MTKDYYIMRSGRLQRKQNTLFVEGKDGVKKAIPVNDVDSLFAFGELDMNTKLLNFLAQKKIPVHFFNYYGFYSGSFYPREQLLAGAFLVKQVGYYTDCSKRMEIAREIINTATYNILQNLLYYRKSGRDVDSSIQAIEKERNSIGTADTIQELMGMEGRVRDTYYQTFDKILRPGFEFEHRSRQPPENMLNCLMSFGNSLVYTTVLSEIYRTQLNPTISFLHEPGERRFSLSLDISEVFKPIIVDRIIFNLINNRMIKEEHFDDELNRCYLNESGRKVFLTEYDAKLRTTLQHRELKRKVSYGHLIRLECYRLIKHILGEKKYEGFRMWW